MIKKINLFGKLSKILILNTILLNVFVANANACTTQLCNGQITVPQGLSYMKPAYDYYIQDNYKYTIVKTITTDNKVVYKKVWNIDEAFDNNTLKVDENTFKISYLIFDANSFNQGVFLDNLYLWTQNLSNIKNQNLSVFIILDNALIHDKLENTSSMYDSNIILPSESNKLASINITTSSNPVNVSLSHKFLNTDSFVTENNNKYLQLALITDNNDPNLPAQLYYSSEYSDACSPKLVYTVPSPIPEPASMLFTLTGMGVMGVSRIFRKKA